MSPILWKEESLRPLIPRVRVGDVLKGTRNLRNYLQTAATLAYVMPLSRSYSGSPRSRSEGSAWLDKLRNYRPSKNDEFLVTVNAWSIFGVCDTNSKVVLLFRNSMVPTLKPGGYTHRRPCMDPTIFSKWFIRTPKKRVDISIWPREPYYMWASLHLNLSHIRGDTRLQFHFPDGPEDLFIPEPNSKRWKRNQLVALFHKWRPRGITRPFSERAFDASQGPRLEEITPMRAQIAEICSNPRISQSVKADSNSFWLPSRLENDQ